MRTIRALIGVAAVVCGVAGPAVAQIEVGASLKDLETAVRRDSNDAAAHYNVALAYWKAKRYDDAERSFRASIALDRRFPLPYVGLGFLPFARRPRLRDEVSENRVPEEWQKPLDEANVMLRRAIVLDPFVDQRLGGAVRQRASDFLVELEQFYGEHVRDYFDALDQFYSGEDQKAFDRFQRVYNFVDGSRHPDRLFDNLIWYHGVSAGRLKKWQEAKWDFDLLLERSLKEERRDSLMFVPLRSNEFLYIKALLSQRLGEPNEAIRLYRQAIESDIGLFMAHVHLAEIYEGAQMWDQAIAERRHAADANPDDPSLLLELGQTLARAGKAADAERALSDARAAAPRDARVAYLLGVVYESLGRADDARAEYSRFLSLAPSRYARQIEIVKNKLGNR
jgi:tetratricopeptide (TPR) repeat protein